MRWPPASSFSSTTPRAAAGAPGRRGPSGAPGGVARRPAARRSISQFAVPDATAAVTPISRTATRPTCQPDGPTAVSLPSPSGPPANAVSTPITQPAETPEAKPHNGAASISGVGIIRTVSIPPAAAARYGAASTARASQAGTPGPDGSAASMGKAGMAPSAEPVGATTVPAPNAKPGPSE